MKKILFAVLIAALSLPLAPINGENAGNHEIFWDAGTVPDSVFRQFILESFDSDKDGRISQAEADTVTSIRLPGRNGDTQYQPVQSLKGIEHFSNLKVLECQDNALTALDLASNHELEELICGGNMFTSLDLSHCNRLKILDTSNPSTDTDNSKARSDGLATLVLPYPSMLEELTCSGHAITSADLSAQVNLRYLRFSFLEGLTSLDLSNCDKLESVYCCDNDNLTSVTLPRTASLEIIECSRNRSLSAIDLDGTPNLRMLDVSSDNITSLDLSACPGILKVYCMLNPLQEFNFSGTALEELGINVGDVRTWIYDSAAEPGKTIAYDKSGTPSDFQGLFAHIRTVDAEIAAERRQAESQRMAAEYKKQILQCMAANDWIGADRLAAEALAEIPEGNAFLFLARAKAYYRLNLVFDTGSNEDMSIYFQAYRSEAEHLVDLCGKSIECDPGDGNEAYFYRGLANIILGRTDDAAEDFMSCARGNESLRAASYYNAGIAYKNASRYGAALEYFKSARLYFPGADDKEMCLQNIRECQEKINQEQQAQTES